MKINHFFNKHFVEFEITEPETLYFLNRKNETLLLENTSFRIMLPECYTDFTYLHPDIWAIIVILALFPFINDSLTLSWSVSPKLAKLVPFEIKPINHLLDSHPLYNTDVKCCSTYADHKSLYYSLTNIDDNVYYIHLNNWNQIQREIIWNYDKQYLFLEYLGTQRKKIYIVNTNLYSTFSTHSLPCGISYIIGCLLMVPVLKISEIIVLYKRKTPHEILFKHDSLDNDQQIFFMKLLKSVNINLTFTGLDITSIIKFTQKTNLGSLLCTCNVCHYCLAIRTFGLTKISFIELQKRNLLDFQKNSSKNLISSLIIQT
jgi:hypothetical protein